MKNPQQRRAVRRLGRLLVVVAATLYLGLASPVQAEEEAGVQCDDCWYPDGRGPVFCSALSIYARNGCCGEGPGDTWCSEDSQGNESWGVICYNPERGCTCDRNGQNCQGVGGEPDCSMCAYPASGPVECAEGGYFDDGCGCCVEPWTPILINLGGKTAVSSRDGGVPFDFLGTGAPVLIPWPVGDNNGWLVLDRNGNGVIENGAELFGNQTALQNGTLARHGFIALAELDTSGDGAIDALDAGFASLAVWIDRSRDGVGKDGELLQLGVAGIRSISLDYHESRHRDRWGNQFRYRAETTFEGGAKRFAYDVILSSR